METMSRWQEHEFGDETRRRWINRRVEAGDPLLGKLYKDKAQAMGRAHLERALGVFDPPRYLARDGDRAGAEGELTDDDLAHYEALGIGDQVHAATQLMNPAAAFYSAYRDGNHVVHAYRPMPGGGAKTDYTGRALPRNVREFDTREEAHAYATSTRIKAEPDIVHYAKDPDDPGHIVQVQAPNSEAEVSVRFCKTSIWGCTARQRWRKMRAKN